MRGKDAVNLIKFPKTIKIHSPLCTKEQTIERVFFSVYYNRFLQLLMIKPPFFRLSAQCNCLIQESSLTIPLVQQKAKCRLLILMRLIRPSLGWLYDDRLIPSMPFYSILMVSSLSVLSIVSKHIFVYFLGVLLISHHPIPGSIEFVDKLRKLGKKLAFVTNNALNSPQIT